MMVLANEYEITLSDGERLMISEIDGETYPEIFSEQTVKSLASLFDRCVQLTRIEVEEFKNGYDQPFRSAIRTPISGMIRSDPPLCAIRKNCIMYKSSVCTLRNIKKNHGLFPNCFEYDGNSSFEIDLGTCIVQAWRLGRYVILVKPNDS
jgi:hypothetical protein